MSIHTQDTGWRLTISPIPSWGRVVRVGLINGSCQNADLYPRAFEPTPPFVRFRPRAFGSCGLPKMQKVKKPNKNRNYFQPKFWQFDGVVSLLGKLGHI